MHPYSDIEYSAFNAVRYLAGTWDKVLSSGGSSLSILSYLAMLQGPVLETADPIDYSADPDSVPAPPAGTPPVKGFITGAEQIPGFGMDIEDRYIYDGNTLKAAAVKRIKQIIMDQGMIAFEFYGKGQDYKDFLYPTVRAKTKDGDFTAKCKVTVK